MVDMEGTGCTSALHAGISEARGIADHSFDVRDEEVTLVKIVALINAHPEHRQSVEGTIESF